MLSLKEVVDRYAALAKQWGDPVALAAFSLTPEETAKLFNSLDEDYHISRFLTFSTGEGPTYQVSRHPVTHFRLDAEIHTLL